MENGYFKLPTADLSTTRKCKSGVPPSNLYNVQSWFHLINSGHSQNSGNPEKKINQLLVVQPRFQNTEVCAETAHRFIVKKIQRQYRKMVCSSQPKSFKLQKSKRQKWPICLFHLVNMAWFVDSSNKGLWASPKFGKSSYQKTLSSNQMIQGTSPMKLRMSECWVCRNYLSWSSNRTR
jgi:hypothetical protein